MAKIVSKNDPDTKKVWCKYGKIPGQGDGVNLFFVGEINVTHYFRVEFYSNRKARPVTGYGTLGSQSLWQSFVEHVKVQGKGLSRIFYKKDHYEDSDDNLVKRG